MNSEIAKAKIGVIGGSGLYNIEGIKDISTEATVTNGYLGILYISVVDSEGGVPHTPQGALEATTIYFTIAAAEDPFPIEMLLIILAVILVGIILVVFARKRVNKGVDHRWEGYEDNYNGYEENYNGYEE